MKITFVFPRIDRRNFTGGLYCALRHANELVFRGHEVSVVAYPKSAMPEWIDLKAKLIVPSKFKWPGGLPLGQASLAMTSYALDYIGYGYKGDYYSRATAHAFMSDILPEADITIATLWETASLVAKHGKGRKAYFCQHYEPLFFDDPVDRSDVDASYSYGLTLIANSSWLKSRLENRLLATAEDKKVYLATNAIDPQVFMPCIPADRRIEGSSSTLRIISYGGRDARWKGFIEMAEAVRAARAALPSMTIEWNVYGPALLSPENHITPYTHLGFLSQAELASAYRMNDVLLSASWYESFPLFPIEAMASGLAVITTPNGTEDYAISEENCLVVEPRDVNSITQAIIRLATDRALLKRIASSATQVANEHNWNLASSKMEKVLRHIISSSDVPTPP
ncbi:MAG TPA: glycosyltransferase family 4 protein [Frateuria sp.]|uniref:glycosyltransferase family 4 protein n=1 Tax=Frateuria sp. TaxID=2211372 RepID=UPI002DE97973|nr:glycosyltransferase family 4 protein [Frateuria sp.]